MAWWDDIGGIPIPGAYSTEGIAPVGPIAPVSPVAPSRLSRFGNRFRESAGSLDPSMFPIPAQRNKISTGTVAADAFSGFMRGLAQGGQARYQREQQGIENKRVDAAAARADEALRLQREGQAADEAARLRQENAQDFREVRDILAPFDAVVADLPGTAQEKQVLRASLFREGISLFRGVRAGGSVEEASARLGALLDQANPGRGLDEETQKIFLHSLRVGQPKGDETNQGFTRRMVGEATQRSVAMTLDREEEGKIRLKMAQEQLQAAERARELAPVEARRQTVGHLHERLVDMQRLGYAAVQAAAGFDAQISPLAQKIQQDLTAVDTSLFTLPPSQNKEAAKLMKEADHYFKQAKALEVMIQKYSVGLPEFLSFKPLPTEDKDPPMGPELPPSEEFEGTPMADPQSGFSKMWEGGKGLVTGALDFPLLPGVTSEGKLVPQTLRTIMQAIDDLPIDALPWGPGRMSEIPGAVLDAAMSFAGVRTDEQKNAAIGDFVRSNINDAGVPSKTFLKASGATSANVAKVHAGTGDANLTRLFFLSRQLRAAGMTEQADQVTAAFLAGMKKAGRTSASAE